MDRTIIQRIPARGLPAVGQGLPAVGQPPAAAANRASTGNQADSEKQAHAESRARSVDVTSADGPVAAARARRRIRLPALTARRGVWLVAAAALGVEMAVAARYGYDRDELYFLQAGRHLAFGYVDQPPLTPLLARLDAILTGNTLAGLRALPALGLAVMVVLTASMARMLGASERGALLAALATACCGDYLGTMHELTTTAPDFVFWTVALWLVIKLLTSGNPRWWLAIGGCAGVALEAKWNIAFLLAGLAAGFLATPSARPLLRGRYLVIAALGAAALAAPDVAWQAAHGWPNLTVFAHLQQDSVVNRVQYWPDQVLNASIVPAVLWIRGLRWSLRDGRFRVIGIASAFVLLAQFALGGKPYYPEGVFTALFAAGAAALSTAASRTTMSRTARPDRITRLAVLFCASGVAAVLLSLPVVPAAALARVPLQKLNFDLGEEIAWPREVALIARVYDSLPASGRAAAVIITGNYGEAGAIDRYGPQDGLPPAYSGHNNFWLWGPPPADNTVPARTVAVVVGISPALLRREFTSVRLAAVYTNGLGVSDQEEGKPVCVATGLRTSWAAAWPAFRHYD